MGCGLSASRSKTIPKPLQTFVSNGPEPSQLNMADPSCNGAYGNWQQSSQLAVQVAELTTNQHQQAKRLFTSDQPLLPPPKPPTTSKSDLLHDHSNNATHHDVRNISATDKQSLEGFTNNILLPFQTAEVQKTVVTNATKNSTGYGDRTTNDDEPTKIIKPIQSDGASINVANQQQLKSTGNDDLASSPSSFKPANGVATLHRSPQAPDTQAMERGAAQASFDLSKAAFEDKVRKEMEELKEQEKIAQQLRENDKMKQQQTLKEKLKKRSELKQKQRREAAAAAASVSAIQEEVPAPDEVLRDIILEPEATTAAPQPSMPVTNKELLYKDGNTDLFSDLEHYAVSMKKVTSESVTFADLMENLLVAQLSDLEKVRIIFHWITAQDLNAINFPSQVKDDTPLGFLLAIKEDRKTYASLFVRLCGAAGLHAKFITGYMKGVGYYPDYKFGGDQDPFRGSWNAVLIDGQWRLIDTNWGARHVTEEEETTSDAWKTEYKYEEHYFLTDSDQLINTHFPDETEWQLLATPWTLTNFEASVKLWPLFYKLKLSLCRHTNGVVEADDSGFVKIQLKVSPFARTDATFKAELKPRRKETRQDFDSLRRCLFHYTEIDEETFDIFLPAPGQYILKIYALSSKYSDENVFTNACFYQINCSQIKTPPKTSVQPPFPVVSSFYGVSVLNSQLVARPVTHPGAVVECNERGEATVVISVVAKDKNISFTHDLLDSSAPGRLLPKCVVHSFDVDNSGLTNLTFVIRTPKPGNYALSLYSNVDDTSSTTFTPFCFYLVNSIKQKQENLEFPQVANKLVGRIQPSFDTLGLDIVSCYPADINNWKTGILHADNNGECFLLLTHSKPLTIIAELSSAQTDYNDFTSVETTGRITAITIRTPVQDPCCLKIYSADIHQTANLPSVYVAITLPTLLKGPILPLPQCPVRIWGPSGITSIKYGLTGISFRNSVSTLKDKLDHPTLNESGPTRIYSGGNDLEVDLELSQPLQLKAKLQNLDGSSANLENYVLLERANITSATIRFRFLNSGSYSLTVYGCATDDNSGQLSPLVYSAVYVTAPSACTLPFPIGFGIWGGSARHLHSPLTQNLERNKEIDIKLFIAKYQKSETGWSTVRYPDVMAVVDGSSPVLISTTSGCEYAWKYTAGPGEKVLGILIKTAEDADGMTYALQFTIE